MKKYLLGLGAMLIGAGLMFVFTHTQVSAEDAKKADWIEIDCPKFSSRRSSFEYCKIKDLTCVVQGLIRKSISCVKSG